MTEETRQRDESKLICALARGVPHAQAAQEAGVSVRTVQRRASDPAFREAVAGARRDMVGEATGRLAIAPERAVETLQDLLGSDADSVRLGASRAILENVLRFREAGELTDRSRQLEEAIESAATNGGPR